MEVGTVLDAVTRRRAMIALLTMGIAVIGGLFSMLNPPTYVATAQALFSVASPEIRPPYALANGSQYILDRMPSYAELGKTTPVLASVVNDLQLHETPLTLTGRIASKSMADKAILQVSAQYDDPGLAARIADATLEQIGQSVSRIENGNIKVTPIGSAVVTHTSPVFNFIIFSVVGAAAGFILAILTAVCLEVLVQRREDRAMHTQP